MGDGEGSTGSDDSSSDSSKDDNYYEGWILLIAVGLILLFVVLGYVSTQFQRRQQLKKLPRYPVQLVSMTTPNTSMLEV
ncbi:hypothetical protein SS50377_21940 [Spironucleus salmonicida]|uniref:Uncharacterized protein n=1 Tax=Spironucleus salmonicida TaxID=348837 RepID=V6LTG1_9EUKA|nr:hypothetical protein SS50377_21940 [Spironucleus salmonicida]|eukprot:EST46981.1 Hypothetical protein SS50377_12933 [Spironucleus salmonicida]